MLGIAITVTIIYAITLMSVFLSNKNNINSEEHEVLEEEDDPSSPVLKYYEENIPGAKPNALYKNTKFMTLDKINGGLLTESEKKQITEVPTGYNFNLKGSGYLIVDVDVDGYFSRISIDDIDDVIKLLNPALKDFDDKIRITEYQFNNKRKKIDSRNFANIFFSSLFMTPYVLTPSKGFHYYFINDLTDDQLTEVFGHSDAKYIKCIGGFTDVIDIDIFVDNKKDDSYIVLPLSNVVIENKRYAVDQENNFKLINVSYSGLRYTEVDGKLCEFRKASTILDWLKKYAKKSEHHTVKQYASKYSDRGRVVSVSPMNKVKYVKYMSKDFDVLSLKCTGISTFASKPFNLYQLMAFIAFFPIDMHLDLLKAFMKKLGDKLSVNAKEQLLTYYYHLAHDEDKEQDLKHPRYLEAVLNNTYLTDIDNKYILECANDEKQNENEDEEVVEDDPDEDDKELEKIVKTMNKRYPELKLPKIMSN